MINKLDEVNSTNSNPYMNVATYIYIYYDMKAGDFSKNLSH